MPTTSSLGDLPASASSAARRPSAVTTVAISGGDDVTQPSGPSRYDRAVSVCACLLLVACGTGIGIWASM